jgi:CRISPR-associated protein Csm4
MKTYKLTLRPLTSFRTPLQSDTIFGHLAWALRYTGGEQALVTFLDRYRHGDPPVLVSAGFPSGTLPAPVLGSGRQKEKGDGEGEKPGLADRVVEGMLQSALEDDGYLPVEQWQEIVGNLSVETLRSARRKAGEQLRQLRKTRRLYPVTRTAVSRITGSAHEGRLFVADETFYGPEEPGMPQPMFDVWHKLDDGDPTLLEQVNDWWRWVERNGFGRRKSAGHGAFRIVGDEGLVEAGPELPQVANPNGFVTLSAWVPRSGDPTDAAYRTRVKRGKLAEGLALPSPWKKPLLMLEPGAVARLERGQSVSEWYGGLIENVHWTEENIVQYGYAFPLPVHVKEGA